MLADVGHEIPTALLPNLLTVTLGAPAAALGLIEGISDALAGAARFGDRLGSRGPIQVLTAGVALFAVAYAACAANTTSWLVLAVPFLAAGAAIGCIETAEHAAVAALAPLDLRGQRSGCWPPSRASATSLPAAWTACSGPECHPP